MEEADAFGSFLDSVFFFKLKSNSYQFISMAETEAKFKAPVAAQ